MPAPSGAGGAGAANIVGAVAGVATSLAKGIGDKKGLYKQAKWMRRRGRVARRLEEWNQAAIRGSIRAASAASGRSAGDTLHMALANEYAAGIAQFEAALPYEMQRAELRFKGQQALLEGIQGAFSSIAGGAAGMMTGGPGGNAISWSEAFGALGFGGGGRGASTVLAPRSSSVGYPSQSRYR